MECVKSGPEEAKDIPNEMSPGHPWCLCVCVCVHVCVCVFVCVCCMFACVHVFVVCAFNCLCMIVCSHAHAHLIYRDKADCYVLQWKCVSTYTDPSSLQVCRNT